MSLANGLYHVKYCSKVGLQTLRGTYSQSLLSVHDVNLGRCAGWDILTVLLVLFNFFLVRWLLRCLVGRKPQPEPEPEKRCYGGRGCGRDLACYRGSQKVLKRKTVLLEAFSQAPCWREGTLFPIIREA